MVAEAARRRSGALRPLALPTERGAWSMLLEPIALAVVPSAAGGLLAVGTAFAFLARHPLKLAVQDSVRQRRFARMRACEWIAFGYAEAATIALLAAFVIGGARPLAPLGAGLLAPLRSPRRSDDHHRTLCVRRVTHLW